MAQAVIIGQKSDGTPIWGVPGTTPTSPGSTPISQPSSQPTSRTVTQPSTVPTLSITPSNLFGTAQNTLRPGESEIQRPTATINNNTSVSPYQRRDVFGEPSRQYFGTSSNIYGEVSQSGEVLRTPDEIWSEQYAAPDVAKTNYDFVTNLAPKIESYNTDVEKYNQDVLNFEQKYPEKLLPDTSPAWAEFAGLQQEKINLDKSKTFTDADVTKALNIGTAFEIYQEKKPIILEPMKNEPVYGTYREAPKQNWYDWTQMKLADMQENAIYSHNPVEGSLGFIGSAGLALGKTVIYDAGKFLFYEVPKAYIGYQAASILMGAKGAANLVHNPVETISKVPLALAAVPIVISAIPGKINNYLSQVSDVAAEGIRTNPGQGVGTFTGFVAAPEIYGSVFGKVAEAYNAKLPKVVDATITEREGITMAGDIRTNVRTQGKVTVKGLFSDKTYDLDITGLSESKPTSPKVTVSSETGKISLRPAGKDAIESVYSITDTNAKSYSDLDNFGLQSSGQRTVKVGGNTYYGEYDIYPDLISERISYPNKPLTESYTSNPMIESEAKISSSKITDISIDSEYGKPNVYTTRETVYSENINPSTKINPLFRSILGKKANILFTDVGNYRSSGSFDFTDGFYQPELEAATSNIEAAAPKVTPKMSELGINEPTVGTQKPTTNSFGRYNAIINQLTTPKYNNAFSSLPSMAQLSKVKPVSNLGIDNFGKASYVSVPDFAQKYAAEPQLGMSSQNRIKGILDLGTNNRQITSSIPGMGVRNEFTGYVDVGNQDQPVPKIGTLFQPDTSSIPGVDVTPRHDMTTKLPGVTPPIIPPIIPPFGFWTPSANDWGYVPQKGKRTKKKTRYTPDFIAMVAGITSKKQPRGFGGLYSGSEIRPIIVR